VDGNEFPIRPCCTLVGEVGWGRGRGRKGGKCRVCS